MGLRAKKIKEYDTKEMKRLIQNTDLKVTIFDTKNYKNLLVDSCTVFWRSGYPEIIGRVFKKKMTKRFVIRICNWLDDLTVAAGEQKGWEEFLKDSVVIKEYEPI
jgi:hypothetical protein